MIFYLYIIVNQITNGCYIGVTKNPVKRWYTHKLIAKKNNQKDTHFQPIHKSINKHGVNNFKFKTLVDFQIENDCYRAEKLLIKKLKSLKIKIYNISEGGKGTGSGINHPMYGKQLPKEWRLNMSKGIKKSYENNPDRKEKLKIAINKRNLKGENHPMYGKNLSDEIKKKISDSNKGKKLSQETKKKISDSNKGKKLSQETKTKLSNIQKNKDISGIKNPNFGNKWTNEQKQNLSFKKIGIKNIAQRKFSDEQVFNILNKKYSLKITSKEIAVLFNCSLTTIKQIVSGKYYQECYKLYFKLQT